MTNDKVEAMRRQVAAGLEAAKNKVAKTTCKCGSPFRFDPIAQALVYYPDFKGMADRLTFRCTRHPECKLEATVFVPLRGEPYDRMARTYEATQVKVEATPPAAPLALPPHETSEGPPPT